jgi:hypothetical protein
MPSLLAINATAQLHWAMAAGTYHYPLKPTMKVIPMPPAHCARQGRLAGEDRAPSAYARRAAKHTVLAAAEQALQES